jgi:hypothetical protein
MVGPLDAQAEDGLMDDRLAEALAPVLRDLATTGSVRPEVRDDQWSDFPGQLCAMLHSPDGSGQGVHVMADQPPQDRVAQAADVVQEWAVEELCARGRATNWPRCPRHPDNHPLAATVREQRAVWVCPREGDLVATVGEIGA